MMHGSEARGCTRLSRRLLYRAAVVGVNGVHGHDP
jgi:hypothetical protein